MRIVILGSAAALVLAGFACSTFSADAVDPPAADAAAPDAPALVEASADGASDAASPDFGCPDAIVSADLSAPLASPFTTNVADPSFESLAEDGGAFGRFTIAAPDGGGVPGSKRYFLQIPTTAQHVCASVRVRVVQAPPQGMFLGEMAAVVHDQAGGYGLGGVEVIGAILSAFAGWVTADGGGPRSPAVNEPVNVANWHVARIDMDRVGDAPWKTTTIAIDGHTVVSNVESFPEGGAFSGGQLGFGPQPLTSMDASAAPIVIDYADFRFAQK
jgi:hypothetical protein